MRLSDNDVGKLITTIGFAPQDGKSEIYRKGYSTYDGYCIFVDFINGKIIYNFTDNPQGVAVKVWDKATINFSQVENFVVLECIVHVRANRKER